MRAAAQLHREGAPSAGSTHAEHTHFIAVLLAEQRHRACFDRLVRAHQPGGNFLVAAQLRVHLRLDCSNVLAR